MNFIDYGLSILNCDLIDAAESQAFDLSDLYTNLGQENQLAGFEVTKRFYEIGTPSGLLEAEGHFRGHLQQ
jgi:NDP-sugar pyrophosphorylase family protein